MCLEHIHTLDQPGLHEIIRSWRDLFDEHYEETGKYMYSL